MSANDLDRKEDASETAFNLLATWWMETIQSAVDLLGQTETLLLLKPHIMNAHQASPKILMAAFGIKDPDFVTSSFLAKVGMDFWLRSNRLEMTLKDHATIGKVKDCPFKDGPVELCLAVCGIGANASGEAFDLGNETINISRLSEGDKECVWVSKPKTLRLPQDLDDLGKDRAMIVPWTFPKEVVDDFAIQYLAEYWIISIRALIDRLGEEQAGFIISPLMKRSGEEYGASRKINGPGGMTDGALIAETISFLNDALKMKGSEIDSKDGFQRTINECPFKDAPPQACKAYEVFCNGICTSIDPHYEFVYDRMMSAGDKDCHWELRKIGSKKTVTMDGKSVDPLKALTIKYATGEITKKEYDEMKKIIGG